MTWIMVKPRTHNDLDEGKGLTMSMTWMRVKPRTHNDLDEGEA